jgi:D-alanyl-D-alanine carboxypeptidase
MRKSIFLISSILAFASSYAQTKIGLKLDSLAHKLEQDQALHGLFSVYLYGENQYFKSIGFKDMQNFQKSDSTTIYAIGSITKPYISTITMLFVEQDKIKLTDPLSTWFPKTPGANNIQIKDLLRHQSGLSDSKYFDWKYRNKKLKFASKNTYANVNYGLLGEILEKVSGKTLSDLISTLISKPHKLYNTSYAIDSSNLTSIATPYVFTKDWLEIPMGSLENAGGAGAMMSTSNDIALFFNALFSNKIVSQSSLNQMCDMSSGYGMGLFPGQFYQYSGYSNSGQFGAFHSTVVHFPDSGLTVVVLCNGLNTSLNNLLKDILTIYYSKPN